MAENDIEIDGLKLHYSDTGQPDGPVVILMHGWGCDHTTVSSIASILEPKMRVLSLDLPGHGKSDEPREIWGVEDYADFVEKFIKMQGLRDFSLIGHSYGGRISIIMGARRDDINSIVLVDAAGVKPRRKLSYYLKVYSYKAMKRLLPLLFGKRTGGNMLDKYRGKVGSSDYRNSSDIMRGIMSRSVNQDLQPYMSSIKAPTLLVWGKEDTATPLSDAKIMERLIPNAGLVAFDGCGHYSFLDNPFGFKAVIREFFKIK
ncbi:MAG: alpha/beta hydrolase [Muribaculaceae bacterium]|nr:alpha/beta hydrolase [Muribaculaceae bacterium]